jgi:hypothetical protein
LLRKLVLACIAAGLTIQPAGASAQVIGRDPFIFVLDSDEQGRDGAGLAWWLLAMIIRPTGTTVAGVPISRINEELGPEANQWCYANALTPNSFVSPFRRVQQEIEQSMRAGGDAVFQASGSFTGGEVLDAVVGNYETCGGVDGAFLLITDRSQSRRIVYVHTFTDWDGLIWLRRDDGALIVAGCFMCGHSEALYYDRARSQFYWRNVGD